MSKIKIEIHSGSCCTYYIDDEKKVLIDAGYKFDKKVDIIIITHCHYDHLFFLSEIAEKWKPVVMAGAKDAESIEKLDLKTLAKNLKPVKVDRKLKEGDVIETGELKLKVIETPGHTEGSICLYDEKEQILFSGDTLFNGDTGRTDLPSGSEEDMQKSLEKLKKLAVKKLYPGH